MEDFLYSLPQWKPHCQDDTETDDDEDDEEDDEDDSDDSEQLDVGDKDG